jgi:hypothetical protein
VRAEARCAGTNAEGDPTCLTADRTFGTLTRELLALSDWLAERGVTHVAMESTGVFWKPVFHLLEGRFQVLRVNARHLKQAPGRKTDVKDSEGMGELLQPCLPTGRTVGSRGASFRPA